MAGMLSGLVAILLGTLISGKGLSTPDFTPLFAEPVDLLGDFPLALALLTGWVVKSLDSPTSTVCNTSTAKGSGRPLATVLVQLSGSVLGINPAATSTETPLPGAGVTGATGVTVVGLGLAVVLGAAAVGATVGVAVGAGLAATVGLGLGAAALSPSPLQLVTTIAKLLTATR